MQTADQFSSPLEIVSAVDRVNHRQKGVLVKKIIAHYGGEKNLAGKKMALWGLAFKPKTDDMREAPSLTIIKQLDELGVSLVAFDPEANGVAKRIFAKTQTKITFANESYEALDGADALLILTEWSEFRRPNFTKINQSLKTPVIFDGRNLFEPSKMLRLGFTYHSIGRATVSNEQMGR